MWNRKGGAPVQPIAPGIVLYSKIYPNTLCKDLTISIAALELGLPNCRHIRRPSNFSRATVR